MAYTYMRGKWVCPEHGKTTSFFDKKDGMRRCFICNEELVKEE